MTTLFDSSKTELSRILQDIESGKIQLPDFQRGWVWDDERVRSLLASVAVAFPIGTIMTLETGGQDINFKPRPIEGTPSTIKNENPETLILDGQQRLTSLYQSLMCKEPVATKDAKGKKVKRFYYISMKVALEKNTDLGEAIIGVSEERAQKGLRGEEKLNLSSAEREYAQDLFPVNRLLKDASGWRRGYNKYWESKQEKTEFYDEFEGKVIKCFEQYYVPIIELTKETPKEAVCMVFEKVNTGGVSLTVFELLTAVFAAGNFNLRDDWNKRKENMKNDVSRILEEPKSDDFLQVISLLATKERRDKNVNGKAIDGHSGISCKRRDILDLTLDEYRRWKDTAEQGFIDAARFLNEMNIFKAKDVPYQTQLVPLASILATLGKEGKATGAKRKISRWYWCGILGELYGSAVETRFAMDLSQVVEYARGKDEIPKTISDAYFVRNRLNTLRARQSAAYKGVYALLMREGNCLEFISGKTMGEQTFHDDAIDIHHIFPKKWCDEHEIPKESYDSIVNKTAISASTNRMIGKKAPSEYLKIMEKKAGISSDDIDAHIKTHGINPEILRKDNYEDFYKDRAEYLLRLIEKATEMKINRDEQTPDSDAQADSYEEDDE